MKHDVIKQSHLRSIEKGVEQNLLFPQKTLTGKPLHRIRAAGLDAYCWKQMISASSWGDALTLQQLADAVHGKPTCQINRK